MITIQHVFYLVGAMFAAFALLSAFDRTNPKRFGNAAFWGLVALSLIAGHRLGDFANGVLVLGLAALASFKLIGRGAPTTGEAERGGRGRAPRQPPVPADPVVLVTAVAGTLLYLYTPLHETGLFERNRETFILLCLGVLLALALIFAWLRPPPLAPLEEGRRLIDAVGWAAVLPMMLAALGLVLADTGVGRTIGDADPDRDPGREHLPGGRRLRPRHGLVHHAHRQRLRRLPGDGGGDRRADPDPGLWRRRRPWSARSACWPAFAAR